MVVAMQDDEIKSLTAIRGIAALMVVVMHYRTNFGSFSLDAHTRFFDKGYLWVDLFFILSGLVITRAYAARFPTVGSFSYFGDFLSKRLGRIYPLHLFMLCGFLVVELSKFRIGGAVHPPFSENTPGTFMLSLGLLQSWGVSHAEVWNVPAWSISAEWAAYLLFPLLLVGLRFGYGKARLAAAILPIIALFVLTAAWGTLNFGFDLRGIVRCLLSFSIGGLIALSLADPQATRPRWQEIDLLCLAAAAAVVATMHFGAFDALVIPGFALLCYGLAGEQGIVGKSLAVFPLYWLGEISYSIYMTHALLLVLWREAARLLHWQDLGYWTGAACFVALILLVIAVSALTYRWVEVPCRQAVRFWLSRHRDLGPRAVEGFGPSGGQPGGTSPRMGR